MTARPVPSALSRRSLLLGGLAAVGAGTLAACGSSSSDTPAAAGGSASGGTGFPVTIEHKFGSTTVEQAPKRVLSLGYTDHEVLLALGIVPVGVIQWIPEWKQGVSTWSVPKLNGTTPALFGYELDFDKAASLRPDLILNVGFDADQKTYDTLKALAPTIEPPKGVKPYGVAWEQMTQLVSKAVGREADGAKLIADTKALLTKTAADNPSFEGKTFAIGNISGSDLSYFTKTDIRSQLLQQLGFVNNDYFAKLDSDDFYGTLSAEQADVLDADVLVFFGEPTDTKESILKRVPSMGTVPAFKEDRTVLITDLEDSMAFSAASVLSIPLALDAIVPEARRITA